ncbi:hypothetical protein BaRGS_00003051 [Batillaria attramentaria]|uniref:Uncharacterized protein n=1 Tax=Batillaria attramentaria TaxID=370345 RepID=A0ABD0M219_9CAEN
MATRTRPSKPCPRLPAKSREGTARIKTRVTERMSTWCRNPRESARTTRDAACLKDILAERENVWHAMVTVSPLPTQLLTARTGTSMMTILCAPGDLTVGAAYAAITTMLRRPGTQALVRPC